MKVKSSAPKEDPETKAKRLVEEARAEADRTSALQGLLDRRQRSIARVFGVSDGGSGASGVVGTRGGTGPGTSGGFDFTQLGKFDPGAIGQDIRIFY